MPIWARVLILLYIFGHGLLAPALSELFTTGPGAFFSARFAALAVSQALIAFPFIFYRHEYGWLHPLFLPFLLSVLKAAFKEPAHLIAPWLFLASPFEAGTTATASVFAQWSNVELGQLRIWHSLITALFTGSIYIGYFFLPPVGLPRLQFAPPIAVPARTVGLALVAISIVATLTFVQMRGGLTAHIFSFVGRRFETLGGFGPVMVLIEVSATALWFWFAFRRRALSDPAFIAATIATCAVVWLASGSRSNVVFFLVGLLAIYVFQRQRIPYTAATMLAVAAFMLFGALGLIRNDFGADTVRWERLDSPLLWLENAANEAESRSEQESTFAALAGAVRGESLSGQSYVGAAFFWVPRAIWLEKPRTVGAFNGAINFAGEDPDGEVTSHAGRPVSHEVEAFWNFGLPGVLGLGLLGGILFNWLARLVVHYRHEPAIWLIYLVTILNIPLGSKTFIDWAQAIIPLLAALVVTGALRLRKQPPSATRLRRSSLELHTTSLD